LPILCPEEQIEYASKPTDVLGVSGVEVGGQDALRSISSLVPNPEWRSAIHAGGR
jgi:hypothetical protein